MGLLTLFTRALSTVQWNLVPLLCSAFACVVNVLLDYALVKTPLAHAGLALATSIGYMVNAILLAMGMRRWLREKGTTLLAREMVMPLVKLILLTLVATGLGWGAVLQVPMLDNAMVFHGVRICVFGMVMGGCYLFLLILFPVPETLALRRKIWLAAKRSGARDC
jgi:peptidoglycan biosynthesis protein MviN/MurJ (putative lipid II flippase)